MDALNPRATEILTKMSSFPTDDRSAYLQYISDSIEELFTLLRTEDLGEVMVNAIQTRIITQEQASDFLGISRWSGSTNGCQLHRTIEKWLEQANDPLRIELALKQEIFPFLDRNRMNQVLNTVAQKHPQFKEEIKNMIERRAAQEDV